MLCSLLKNEIENNLYLTLYHVVCLKLQFSIKDLSKKINRKPEFEYFYGSSFLLLWLRSVIEEWNEEFFTCTARNLIISLLFIFFKQITRITTKIIKTTAPTETPMISDMLSPPICWYKNTRSYYCLCKK